MKDEILNHWQIQESLLQSYRATFLTSQSIVFSIGAIIVSNESFSFARLIVLIILFLLALLLVIIWINVAGSRAMAVSYFQVLLIKAEKGDVLDSNILMNFKKWQDIPKSEKKHFLQQNEIHIKKSDTRKVMEKYLPYSFLFLWFLLFVIVMITLVNTGIKH